MPKRGRSSSSSRGKRSKSRSKSRSRSRNRKGYGSVARSRGAAVTGEMKYFDCERVGTALVVPTTSWLPTTIMDPSSTINLGDTAVPNPACLFVPKATASLNGRIGRKVLVHSIKVRGYLKCPTISGEADLVEPTHVRLLLVLDMQTNASQMLPSAVLNGGSEVNTTINSYMNPNNFGRFRILKDLKFNFASSAAANNNAATTITMMQPMKNWKMSHKFKTPLLVDFNATNGGTVADIIDNSFHIMTGASDISINPFIAYYSRVSYTDP